MHKAEKHEKHHHKHDHRHWCLLCNTKVFGPVDNLEELLVSAKTESDTVSILQNILQHVTGGTLVTGKWWVLLEFSKIQSTLRIPKWVDMILSICDLVDYVVFWPHYLNCVSWKWNFDDFLRFIVASSLWGLDCWCLKLLLDGIFFMIELANLGDTLLWNSEVTRIKSLPNSYHLSSIFQLNSFERLLKMSENIQTLPIR
jgi:hypothetical protein